ncbi:MAG: hypothetical protein U0519_01500 [Candidatus Gracilibacteria bacterium]
MKTTTNKIFHWAFIGMTVLALAGCGSSNTQQKPTTDERSRIIDNTEFTMRIPREWDVIEAKDFTSDVPEETVLVVRNNVKNDNFTANVNVVRRDLQSTKETLEYAKEVINRQKTGLLNYKESKRDVLKIKIGDKETDSYLVNFEGKKDPQSDLVTFVQAYGVKGTKGYIITGSYTAQESGNNKNTVEEIVKSLSLK